MKRGLALVLVVLSMAVVLTGCGDFQQRATEIQSAIGNAENKAETAEQAAARNTGRLLELEQRVDELEAALEDLQGQLTEVGSP